MTYRVIIQPSAGAEIAEASRWIAQRSAEAALKWLDGVEAALETLREHPLRCPSAPENGVFSEEIRQLLYGKREHTYRILFTVRGDEVHILHLRHGARLPLRPEDAA